MKKEIVRTLTKHTYLFGKFTNNNGNITINNEDLVTLETYRSLSKRELNAYFSQGYSLIENNATPVQAKVNIDDFVKVAEIIPL